MGNKVPVWGRHAHTRRASLHKQQQGDEAEEEGVQLQKRREAHVVVERQPDGTLREYAIGTPGWRVATDREADTKEEEHGSRGMEGGEALVDMNNSSQSSRLAYALPRSVRIFFFPSGFPHSVSPDYLHYMLWQLPVHVTGWASSAIVTSALLQAVGVGQSGVSAAASAAAASAAIKWVTKDGLGAVGKLFIGGLFGGIFDEDPKQWRMYADVVGSAGSLFELATPLAPPWFLLLASLGNLTKAVARGLKDPSSRVIQTHFATQGNMGDVVAKDEVWRVVGQMLGLAAGVGLLSTPFVTGSLWTLVGTWFVVRGAHLAFRFRSLSVLSFDTLNFKRTAILAGAHVAGEPIPGMVEVNRRESILVPRRFSRPSIKFGASLEDAHGFLLSQYRFRGLVDPTEVQAVLGCILKAHEEELHVLIPGLSAASFLVLFKEGASSRTMVRSIWQAEWMQQNARAPPLHRSLPSSQALLSASSPSSSSSSSPRSSPSFRQANCDGAPISGPVPSEEEDVLLPGPLAVVFQAGSLAKGKGLGCATFGLSLVGSETVVLVNASLGALEGRFSSFLGAVEAQGMDVEAPVLKVPQSSPMLVL